jgi:hypothetical protein
MPTRQEYEKTSLAGGEVSPALHGATDLRVNQTGVEIQENFVTVLEGIAVRRPGTRFVLEAKDHSQRGKLWPFRYTSGDYYMLAFNGGAMRVIRDAGYVVSGPSPFEMAIPWSEGQLASLRAAPLNNTLTFTVAGGRIRVVTRIAADNWTVAEYLPLNGPVEAQNLDKSKTVLPDAITGAVNLLGAGNPFDAGMIGGVMRIDEASAALTALWTAGEAIQQPFIDPGAATSQFGDMAGLPNLIDADATTDATAAGVSSCYAGFHYTVPVAVDFLQLKTKITGGITGTQQTLYLEIWGSNGAAPASGISGVLLGRRIILDQDNLVDGVNTYSGDTETAWNNVWFRIVAQAGPTNFSVASLELLQRVTGLPPVLRRWNDSIYEAASDGDAGSAPPVHDDGDAAYGGLTWRFRSKTYGFVRIAVVTDANHASGTVALRLPDSALVRPSYRWSPPSWSDGAGWPDIVMQNRQKFLFIRKNRLWGSQPETKDNFLFTADTDSAIAVALTSDEQSLPEIQWAASGGIVILGAADMEWMLRAPGSNDVLQAQTIDPEDESREGSIAQIPARVDRGVIFIGRNARRLHYVEADKLVQKLDPEEISAAARHILGAGVVRIVWQRDPHKIGWIQLADGGLAAVTFMPKQKILAFHRHPMQNGYVEDIAVIPALDDGRTELYLWVRRTINGATKRYIELLQPFFEPVDKANPTAAGAWFLDCALRYSGPPVSTISGLGHLENEVVGVFADGAMQQTKRVTGGSIPLDRAASDVVVGIPIVAHLRDLPRSLQIGGGSTRGKKQRANTIIVDVLNSAAGTARVTHPKQDRNSGPDDTPFDDLIETGADAYGLPIKLFTGQIELTVSSEGATSAVVEIITNSAMPMSVRAIVPDLIVEGD